MPSEKLHQIRQNFVNYPAKLKTTSMADVTITKPLCDWLGTVQTVYDLRNFFLAAAWHALVSYCIVTQISIAVLIYPRCG